MLENEEAWLLKEKHQGIKTDGFYTDCERLKAGEPLAYVIGYVPFLDCKIWLDSKPLIPRAETEFLVEHLIRVIKKRHSPSPLKILDLCAGSGCIGVSLAQAIPNTLVDFIEIEKSHLSLIEKNCQENKISLNRVRFIASDLFANLKVPILYDYIVSNPPYIDPVLDRAETTVKKYEPGLALYGGEHGLEIINRIITQSPTYLTVNSELWLEHEPEQTKEIQFLGNDRYFVTTYQDQYQLDRYSMLLLK